jgi:hypothetical protein
MVEGENVTRGGKMSFFVIFFLTALDEKFMENRQLQGMKIEPLIFYFDI